MASEVEIAKNQVEISSRDAIIINIYFNDTNQPI